MQEAYREQVESLGAATMPFSLKQELWRIYHEERQDCWKHQFDLYPSGSVIRISYQQEREGRVISHQEYYWENPIDYVPPQSLLIIDSSKFATMILPEENE